MKHSSIPDFVCVFITSFHQMRQDESTSTSISELIDLSFMHTALKKRISSNISISDIEQAFNEPSSAPGPAVEAVAAIVFEPKEPCLEKAFMLRNFYENSTDAKNSAVKKKIIRNLGYLLFAKELWFKQNPELAQSMFPNQKFDAMFFKKRSDQIYQFLKKGAPVRNHAPMR